jgi:hypothetical protein
MEAKISSETLLTTGKTTVVIVSSRGTPFLKRKLQLLFS